MNSKTPIWKRSMLAELNLISIKANLEEIADDQCTRKYDNKYTNLNSTAAFYYELFREDFVYLECRACELLDTLNYRYELISEEDFNDLSVAVLGDTHKVLGFDVVEQDYFHMFDSCEKWATEETAKRVKRWTKDEILEKYAQVFTIITTYLEITSGISGIEVALAAIEEEGTTLEKNMNAVERAYNELFGERHNEKAFNLAIAKIPQKMWIE